MTAADGHAVRVEAEDGDDVWLVWSDADYYGPHLQAVLPSRAEAIAWAEASKEANRYLSVEGVAFGAYGLMG